MCFELAFESNPRIQTILGDPAADSGGWGGGGGGGGGGEWKSKAVHSTNKLFSTSNFSCPFRCFSRPNYPPLGSPSMCSD